MFARLKRTRRALELSAMSILIGTVGCPKVSRSVEYSSVSPSGSDSLEVTLSARTSIRIRGLKSVAANEPLYVVDGIPIQQDDTHPATVSFLDPRDIQSIEMLKGDAATAIYGSSAANGLIVISTAMGTADSSEAPDVGQFPEPTLKFRLGGNRELAQGYVESLLTHRR